MADDANTTGTQGQADNGQQSTQNQAAQGQQQTQQQTTDKGGDKVYTQADLDRIVQERLARAKPKADAPAQTEQNAAPADGVNSALEAQIATMRSAMVTSEIRAVMAVSGVQAEKVERGARLIDPAKCVDKTGMPDKAKITAEIEAMIKDFPEMKVASENSASGFRIGADGGNAGKPEQADAISAIFGNKKG